MSADASRWSSSGFNAAALVLDDVAGARGVRTTERG